MATTKNIQSVERAFAVLELYQKKDVEELGVKEISDALGLNKSTAFGLINTLNNLEYLQRNPVNQKYALGVRLLSLSDAVKLKSAIIRTVHPYLEQIMQKYGETVHCGVEHRNGVLYIDKVEATHSAIYINTQIGKVNDYHCTGVGKCILAYLPPERQKQIYAEPLKTMTYNTITNVEQLRNEIRKVRENGFAMDNEENALGLSCVAVPVFSAAETVGCAISVSGMTSRIQHACQHGIIEELKQISAEVSKKTFGYDCGREEK